MAYGGYYQSNDSYGWTKPTPATDLYPVGGPTGYLEENQPFSYTRNMGSLGVGGSESNFDRWVRSEEANVRRGYGAAVATNPNLTFQNFIKTLGGEQDWRNRFQAIDPGSRGENFSQYAPVARWLGNG